MRQCPKCGRRFLADHVKVCDADGSALEQVVLANARDRLVGAVVQDEYQIDGVLGDGGMGVVYSATHVRDPAARFAVKVLRAEYTDEEDLVQRFQQEAESVAAIRHPNIVEVFRFGVLPDGSRFFIMELLEGKSLGQVLSAQPRAAGSERRRALPEVLTLHVGQQICAGLAAAHATGVVHRDMKPDNVHLVRRADDPHVVKILDFGIAKVQGAKSARTRTGSVFGTPHYMSPEQASGERDIDARTDVYAVGVLLYEMGTGKVPFDADNLMGILTAHLYHAPLAPRLHREGEEMSRGLESVIMKALSKDRAARYASMDELREDLLRVARGEAPAAARAAEQTAVYSQAPAPDDLDDEPGQHTVPEGRLSRGPRNGASALAAATTPAVDDLGDEFFDAPATVTTEAFGAALAPAPRLATGATIPPVTADATTLGSDTVPPGAARSARSRTALLAALAGVGALSLLAAVLVARARRGDAGAVPGTRDGSAVEVLARPRDAAPATAASTAEPPGRSPTIVLRSDPPRARVSLDERARGTTPLSVPRPLEGAVTYVLSAEGRARTAVVVRADSPDDMLVALGVRLPTPGVRPRPPRPGETGPHRDLLNPWAQAPR